MTDRRVFKNHLQQVDRHTRICLLYLEDTMNEKFKLALQVKQPKIPKVDFSKIESKCDSLQKQINGLRAKTDTTFAFTQEYASAEIFLKNIIKKADSVLGEMKSIFEELYETGYFKEGVRRRIREGGLLKNES